MAAAKPRARPDVLPVPKPRKSLDPRPADVVAAERAETTDRLGQLAAIEAQLEAAHGPSWRVAGNAAQALASPDILRVMLGVPHPGPVPSASHLADMRVAKHERDDMLEALADAGYVLGPDEGDGVECVRRCLADLSTSQDVSEEYAAACDAIHRLYPDAHDDTSLADSIRAMPGRLAESAATVIDDTTPEGVLALLDAATSAALHLFGETPALVLEGARDYLAGYLDLPLRNPGRARATEPAARRSEVERMADTFAAHESAVLLGLLMADAADLPCVMRAAIGGRGQGEDSAVKRIAAVALALVGKLTKGGAW